MYNKKDYLLFEKIITIIIKLKKKFINYELKRKYEKINIIKNDNNN